MKVFLKSLLFLFVALLLSNSVSAQRKSQYYVTVNQKQGKRIVGRLVAINDSAIVVADKQYKGEVKENVILLTNIKKITAHKQRGGVLYTVITGAGVAGNAVFAFTQYSASTALGVATGGTLGIVLLAVLINKVAAPSLAKLSGSDQMTFSNISETFKVYIQRTDLKEAPAIN